jgi:hypothetical protein
VAQDFTDGNVLAGPLGELFAVDVTAADGRCTSCGLLGPIASLRVYGYDNGPGLVARCPRCEAVVLRVVTAPGRTFLDMRGIVSLRIPTAAA